MFKRAVNLRWVVLLAVLLLASCGTRADGIEEDSAKAGFILNFAKFVEWPAGVLEGDQLLVCSLSPRSLSGKLALLDGQVVQGRAVSVRAPVRHSDLRNCQVVFIAADEQQRVDLVLKQLGQSPVLTVSDMPDFVQAGGIIGLRQREGRIRFVINQRTARQHGLHLRSHLLRLADEVLQ